MIADDILDGIICSICLEDFRDTEGTRIAHGSPVVCRECWSKLPLDKRQHLKKAFFFTAGYAFNVIVPYQKQMIELTVRPLHNIDQILYEIYDDKLMCVVAINEKANWDVDRDINRGFVYEIGRAIDQKENE